VVLYSTTLLFVVDRGSLAEMLAETDSESEMMEESKSACWRLILGSTPVDALSLLATLAFELMPRGKKRI
jgi:hypothetical protein